MEAPGEPGRGGDHRRDRECDQPTRDGPGEEEPRVRAGRDRADGARAGQTARG